MRRADRSKTPEGAANSSYVHFLFGLIFKYEATTGKGIGLRVPMTGLGRADEVIERGWRCVSPLLRLYAARTNRFRRLGGYFLAGGQV